MSFYKKVDKLFRKHEKLIARKNSHTLKANVFPFRLLLIR